MTITSVFNIFAFVIVTCIPLVAHAGGEICLAAANRAALTRAAGRTGSSRADCTADSPEDFGDGIYEVAVSCNTEEFHSFRVKTEIHDSQCAMVSIEEVN